jgi:hypothetical protein
MELKLIQSFRGHLTIGGMYRRMFVVGKLPASAILPSLPIVPMLMIR